MPLTSISAQFIHPGRYSEVQVQVQVVDLPVHTYKRQTTVKFIEKTTTVHGVQLQSTKSTECRLLVVFCFCACMIHL